MLDLGGNIGFYFDLAQSLSEVSGEHKYEFVYVPRKRLDVMIAQDGFDGLVVGAVPSWFKDKNETKYFWSDGFFPDKDHYVSLKLNRFEFTSNESIKGKSIGVVAGLYYKGINESAEKGELDRVETIGDMQVLELIQKRRVEVGLISDSLFKYYNKTNQIDDIYYLSSTPHDVFIRRAFTTKNNQQIFKSFVKDLSILKHNLQINNLVTKYID